MTTPTAAVTDTAKAAATVMVGAVHDVALFLCGPTEHREGLRRRSSLALVSSKSSVAAQTKLKNSFLLLLCKQFHTKFSSKKTYDK